MALKRGYGQYLTEMFVGIWYTVPNFVAHLVLKVKGWKDSIPSACHAQAGPQFKPVVQHLRQVHSKRFSPPTREGGGRVSCELLSRFRLVGHK